MVEVETCGRRDENSWRDGERQKEKERVGMEVF